MGIRLLFEPRDLWVGVYWDLRPKELRIYVCFLPCLPILITVTR